MDEEEEFKCHICGNDRIGEGLILKKQRTYTDRNYLILCWDCWDLIKTIIHDTILEELGNLQNDLKRGFDKLEGWTYKEERPETSQTEFGEPKSE